MVTVEEDEWSDYGVDDDIQYAEEATSQAATARNNLNPALRSAVEQAARNVSIGAGTVAYKAPRPSRPKLGPNLYFIQGYQFFNYSRLLSVRGFKRLRTLYDQIEFSDDPAKSLDSLMRVYRDWAHHFYPLYRFQDFIDKVEMHCKSNVMKVYLSSLRRAMEQGGEFNEAQYLADQDLVEASAAMAIADNIDVKQEETQ